MDNDMVYVFLLNMWIMGKVDESYLNGQVSKGRISEDEKKKKKKMILATPQVSRQ